MIKCTLYCGSIFVSQVNVTVSSKYCTFNDHDSSVTKVWKCLGYLNQKLLKFLNLKISGIFMAKRNGKEIYSELSKKFNKYFARPLQSVGKWYCTGAGV